MAKRGNPNTKLFTSSLTRPGLYLGDIGSATLLFRGRDWNGRNRPDVLFYGFSRQCSRMPFLLAGALRYGPYADPLSSMSVLAARCSATLSTRTLLYSRIKTRVPDREHRGNFVPKFITRSCCGSRGWTSLPGARTLLTFLAPSLRALLRRPAHTRTRVSVFIGLRPAMPHLCACERVF